MHSQGRGLNSVMINKLGEDIDTYTLREAEFGCNAIVGFNFGDGHLHDQQLIQAIQKRCQFAPGEFIVVWVESEPVCSGRPAVLGDGRGRRRRRARQLARCKDASTPSNRGCPTVRSRSRSTPHGGLRAGALSTGEAQRRCGPNRSDARHRVMMRGVHRATAR